MHYMYISYTKGDSLTPIYEVPTIIVINQYPAFLSTYAGLSTAKTNRKDMHDQPVLRSQTHHPSWFEGVGSIDVGMDAHLFYAASCLVMGAGQFSRVDLSGRQCFAVQGWNLIKKPDAPDGDANSGLASLFHFLCGTGLCRPCVSVHRPRP